MALRVIAAPAKVNLHLEVLGRRDDGFHALETVFQTLELADRVAVEVLPGDGIELVCDDPGLPADAANLAWRAAEAFRARLPLAGRVRIELGKRVPAGAGLGGGSSDAAAVLRALAALAPKAPPPAELAAAAAAALGSDVPFFLVGGTAHALGRGERITALPDLPRLPVTVLKPPPALATPRVFAALTDAERGPRAEAGVDAWRARLAEGRVEPLRNRLTGPARRLEPAVDALLGWLERRGVPHLLSGSGSACFALAHVEPPEGVQAWRTWTRPRARLDAID